MEGDKSPVEDLQNEHFAYLAHNVEGFQKLVDEIFELVEEDESFCEMTAKIYDQKKSCMKAHLLKLSSMHKLLAERYADLIEQVGKKNCTSLTRKETKDPGGCSALKSSMPSVYNAQVPLVNDVALKQEETKDSEGSESSLSYVNKPPANDDERRAKLETETMKLKVDEYMSEISQLQSAHEKKMKISNDGVTAQLRNAIKENSDLVDDLFKKLENKDNQQDDELWAEKLFQDVLIKLKNPLRSVKFDNVQKLKR